MYGVTGMLEPEGGAIVQAALDALLAGVPSDDGRSREQQRADALVDLAELARSHALLPVTGGHRPEIVVHAPAAALVSAAAPALTGTEAPGATTAAVPPPAALTPALVGAAAPAGPALLDTGAPLTDTALERLGCDARFRRLLLDQAGIPTELGRTTRIVPPALRKHVALRDGGCRYPGCPRAAAYCEAHHAVFWRHGGTTSADNLVLLCRYHHHLVHDRHHDLKLRPDATVKVARPDGRVLTSRPRGPTTVPV